MIHLALACCDTAAYLHAVQKCESTLLKIWKRFAVSPLRSACLAMHQTTMKTKGQRIAASMQNKMFVK